MAERFATAGMKIVMADVESSVLKKAAGEMRKAGHDVLPVRTDVSKAASVEALARKSFDHFGAVHIVCNNAGVYPQHRTIPVWEAPLADWKWALDVNVWGVVHGIHSFVPRMLERGEEGHIVNTASLAGLISGAGSTVYGTTKHAVVRLTEGLYAGLRDRKANIGVSMVCPGMVDTGIFNSERNRPKSAPVADSERLDPSLLRRAMTPQAVAEQVFAAVRGNKFYVITTSSYDDALHGRMTAIMERRNPKFPSIKTMSSRNSKAV
jgi:NAD(P)-dependent dehydrogenase (short-subunit alcohol dehydrogenase family)